MAGPGPCSPRGGRIAGCGVRAAVAVLVALLPAVVPQARAAEDDAGLWLAAFGQGRFGAAETTAGRVRWWLDLQARWRDGADELDATILRPALGYALTPAVTVHAGYALVTTHPPGLAGAATEHRPWQQLTWILPVTAVALTSRTRLEQRFPEGTGEAGHRLRQFVRATRRAPAGAAGYLTAYDEVFVELNDTGWGQRAGVRQNRAFAGLGWFIDRERRTAVEVGYLNQWVDRPGPDRVSHVLSLNLFINR
jgi:hypothetical protein